MTFVDEVRIRVRSGHGGPGCVHFLRQAHRPRMGPDGGDGGRGAHVYFVATRNMHSLLDFRYNPKYFAPNGEPGMGTQKNGRSAEDLIVRVPLGTCLYDADTNELLADLVEDEVQIMVAKGGRGGLGNMNFATPTRQAPEFAQPGEEGMERNIRLELKLMADVGLLGFPNAGKSTLISKLSAAKPKIGNYPFTTLSPQLGVVKSPSGSFVLADVPGLIEGAHEGRGLGTKFLKHLERTRVLLMLLDGDPHCGRGLFEQYEKLMVEIGNFSEELAAKPLHIAINKTDAFQKEELESEDLEKIKKVSSKSIAFISGVSGEGLNALVDTLDKDITLAGEREWANKIADTLKFGKQELFNES